MRTKTARGTLVSIVGFLLWVGLWYIVPAAMTGEHGAGVEAAILAIVFPLAAVGLIGACYAITRVIEWVMAGEER